MAKAKAGQQDIQIDMFPVEPMIIGLYISSFSIKDGNIKADLGGATMVSDVVELTDDVWRKAISEWLVVRCGNNGELIDGYISEARSKERDRQIERDAFHNAMHISKKIH